MKKRWVIATTAAAVVAASFVLLSIANRERSEAVPIEGKSSAPIQWDATYTSTSVPGTSEAHPYLASIGMMHGDGFQSDTHSAVGPMGTALEVRTRQAGNTLPRQCATYVIRSDGKIVSMCGGIAGFRIVLIDPATLEALASYDLPLRPSSFQALIKRDPNLMMSDTSGGAYLFLDNQDRIVLGDSRQMIQRIAMRQEGGKWRFVVDKEWDMRPYVPHDCQNYDNWFPPGACDMITSVAPDYAGRYWWVTRFGRVGTLDPETGLVKQVQLQNEEIQNGVAMDSRAVYVLSDHAQYAFAADKDGMPQQLWRQAYDRGSERKVGSINQGSGTTPTLIGDRYITYADNADSRINIIVLRRGDLQPGEQREVCRVPVFTAGKSATDNSMIGWGRSILLENNYGYQNAHVQKDWNAVMGGVVRVDIREDESGCDTIWTSPLKVPSVAAKMSAGNGIAYYYTFDIGPEGKPDWSIAGLDFRTGKQVIKIPTGQGKVFDTNWATMAIAPDGALYVGTTRGLVQVRQRN
ncbi:hypothetical protein NVV93_18135 [Pseudomonas sp. LS44]|uniref:hypothetical protein n=1 Tax=Pseudomonas sp. LS44 TaxID=1357074 RepID=UPI00215A5DC3|nr:hypothetical protein [Pseudomonas sp. LS44]UVE17464.1 hypothetical protein NVV93_18135 [Pseudomonas sp. LS44]